MPWPWPGSRPVTQPWPSPQLSAKGPRPPLPPLQPSSDSEPSLTLASPADARGLTQVPPAGTNKPSAPGYGSSPAATCLAGARTHPGSQHPLLPGSHVAKTPGLRAPCLRPRNGKVRTSTHRLVALEKPARHLHCPQSDVGQLRGEGTAERPESPAPPVPSRLDAQVTETRGACPLPAPHLLTRADRGPPVQAWTAGVARDPTSKDPGGTVSPIKRLQRYAWALIPTKAVRYPQTLTCFSRVNSFCSLERVPGSSQSQTKGPASVFFSTPVNIVQTTLQGGAGAWRTVCEGVHVCVCACL